MRKLILLFLLTVTGVTFGQDFWFINQAGTDTVRITIDTDGKFKIDGTAVQPSAFVLDSLTTTQRDALSAVNGMLIYNSTDDQIQGYDNGAWFDAGGAASGAPTDVKYLVEEPSASLSAEIATNSLTKEAVATGDTLIYKDGVGWKVGTITVGGGSSEWTDNGTTLEMNETGDDLIVGAAQINSAKLSIDGDADQEQLAIQGHSTQNAFIIHVENSAGSSLFALDPAGILTLPQLTASRLVATDGTSQLVSTITEANLESSVSDASNIIVSTEIDTYSELNTIVADQTLTHNALIDTYAELDAIVADVTLSHSSLTETLTNKTINTASNTITVVESDISDLAHVTNYVTDNADDTMAGDLTIDDDDAGTALTVRADAAGAAAGTPNVGILITTDDDDDTDYDPFEIRDDSGVLNDLLFAIDHTGAITSGTIAVGSVTGTTTDLSVDLIEESELTNSADLRGQLSDETGTGLAVFGTAPQFLSSIQIGATGVRISTDDDGALTFLGNSAGFDEDFTINLDDVSNEITVTTSTGVTQFNFSSIALQESGAEIPNVGEAAAITGTWEIQDDTDLNIGNDADWSIQYDEAVDNQLLFETTNTAAVATTDPMVEFLVGTTPTADQQVFGVAKGTQATNTPLLTLDEDGDLDVLGVILAGSGNTQITNADGTIDDDQVAFDDADANFTATAIGPAIEELDDVNGSGPNAADGKVEWSQLVGMPAGFSDGTDDTGAGSGAFSDAGDPAVLNTTTKDVNIGTTHNNTAKLSVDGDADQVQFTVQEFSTQNDASVIVETSAGTEIMTVEPGGLITTLVGIDAIGAVDFDIGSADVTDVTVVTDGGTVVLDGNITQDAGTTLFMGGLLDATGAVDMDYGSADITDHTFIADGTTDADFVVPLTSIGGAEIVSDDIGPTQIDETAVYTWSGANLLTGVHEVADDIDFNFGTDADWSIQYDEGVDNQLIFETTNTSAVATTDPMFEILVGTTPTADQQVFGVAKGTQASNTALFTVDEDGDGDFAGGLTLGTVLGVPSGGMGAGTFTDGGILLGSGTGAVTALGVATNGQIPIGDGTTDPVLATITGTTDEVTVTNGAGTITLTVPDVYKQIEFVAGFFNPGAGDLTGATSLADDADNTNDFTTDQLEFSASAENYISGAVRMPRDWDGTTAPKFIITSYSETAHATNTAEWAIQTGYIRPDTDSWIAALGTAVTQTRTYVTADIWYDTATMSPTPAGTAEANCFLKIRIHRDGDDATNDTHTGTTRLVSVIMVYKKTIYGDETDI